MERTDDVRLALEAAVAAGLVAQASFGGEHDVVYKSADQPLTPADLEANRVLRERLGGARPEYGWLSEETADRPDRLRRARVWIVDPIDGTRSYIHGRPEYVVSVGLAEGGRAVVGVVYNPASGELYWAAEGGGARAADLPAEQVEGEVAPVVEAVLERARPLRVSGRDTEEQAELVASRSELAAGEFDPFHGGWRIRPVGSTAYKMALVAAGEADVFLSRGPKSEWDVCAAGLIVAEAGGRTTDLRGEVPRYNGPDPYVHGILTSNGRLHDLVLAKVAALPPGARLRGEPRMSRDEED